MREPITTTLNRIRAHRPCASGWAKLLAHLGKTQADDEPVEFAAILASNGLDDALWCTQAEPQHAALWRLYAVRCAHKVQHLMTDERSIKALDVAERFTCGGATKEELTAASAAAWSAVWSAASATGAARSAAWSAARAAASDAAWSAAWSAASATGAARSAAGAAASDAARDAARDAAWSAARSEQAAMFLELVAPPLDSATANA